MHALLVENWPLLEVTGKKNILIHCLLIYLHRLLIGAPKARALSNQGANITGGLYSCEITTHPDDCTRVDFDNDGMQKNKRKGFTPEI